MYWVGAAAKARSPNGEQTNKILEKFQTDFWFICHLQIKAGGVPAAVACQHPGGSFICYFCWWVDGWPLAGQMKPHWSPALTQSQHCPPVDHFPTSTKP